jgi:hypothetical protein
MKQNIGSGINLEYKSQKPNISSIDLIRDLQPITIEDLVPQLRDKEYHFTVVPKDIMYMNNGIRHYYVEIQCDDGNFVVNAHGNEAERLFKAVHSISE